jgi:protein-L-isoaspartate(D-aspartate) O-methyltransferase
MNQLEELSPIEKMLRQQVMDRGIRDPRVIEAMRSVPREAFFPKDVRDKAYADGAAPIGHGQTISQPYIVALMTQRLDVHANHRVLEIGTGSGYQTCVLARLAKEVYTLERVKPLLDEAFERVFTTEPEARPLPPRRRHKRLARGRAIRPHLNHRRRARAARETAEGPVS